MANSIKTVGKEPYLLYTFPPEAYPRYKYFRNRALNLMGRTDQLLDTIGMEEKLRQQMKEWKVQMADKVRVVVQGEEKHNIPLKHLVKKMKSTYPDPVEASMDQVRDLRNVSDVIVMPFSTSEMALKEMEETLLIRRKSVIPNLADNIIFFNMSPSTMNMMKGKEQGVLEKLFVKHLDGTTEQFQERCVRIGDLPDAVSRMLEERVMHILADVEVTVKSCSKDVPRHLCQDQSMMRNIITKLLHEEAYLQGWSEEFVAENIELSKDKKIKSDADILQDFHDNSKHSVQIVDCKVCLLVDKLCDTLGNCLELNLHNIMRRSNKGFNKLPSGEMARTFHNMRKDVTQTIVRNLQTSTENRLRRLSMEQRYQQKVSEKETDSKTQGTSKFPGQNINPTSKEIYGFPPLPLKEEVKVVHRLRRKAYVTNAILSNWKEAMQQLVDKADISWKHNLHQVHWEMVGLFEESGISEFQQKGRVDHKAIDSAKKYLLKNMKFVKGCGYCYGQLRVDVDENELKINRPKLEQEISECLKKRFGIEDFKLVEAKEIVQFHEDGSQVKTERGHGTLGGVCHVAFRSQWSDSKEKKMCALVSKHVVENCQSIYVGDTNQERICIGKYSSVGENSYDIALVLIDNDISQHFQIGFKDLEGNRVENCTILRSASKGRKDPFTGLRKVHIWGATSKPGKGIVECSDYLTDRHDDGNVSDSTGTDDDHDDGDMDHLLFFRDYKEDYKEDTSSAFCGPGDSGAIVLADDPDDDERLRVVAMIIGKMGESYCGFKLVGGLKSLQSVTRLQENVVIDKFIIGGDEIG